MCQKLHPNRQYKFSVGTLTKKTAIVVNKTLGGHSDTPKDHEERKPKSRPKAFQEDVRRYLISNSVISTGYN
jgi:hypothetical protein